MTLNQRHAEQLAREYVAAVDGDWLKVRLPCCGRSIRWLRISPEGAAFLRSLGIPADLVIGSARCDNCERLVKVQSEDLHFAGAKHR